MKRINKRPLGPRYSIQIFAELRRATNAYCCQRFTANAQRNFLNKYTYFVSHVNHTDSNENEQKMSFLLFMLPSTREKLQMLHRVSVGISWTPYACDRTAANQIGSRICLLLSPHTLILLWTNYDYFRTFSNKIINIWKHFVRRYHFFARTTRCAHYNNNVRPFTNFCRIYKKKSSATRFCHCLVSIFLCTCVHCLNHIFH